MKIPSRLHLMSDLFLVAQLILAIVMVPSWRALDAPTAFAALGCVLTTLRVLQLRATNRRGGFDERLAAAVFLAGMPVIYIWSQILYGSGTLTVELAGAAIFAVLAILGFKRPMLLAVSIALHGVAWDLPHTYTQTVVAPWYAIACFGVDVLFALAIVTSLPHGALTRAYGDQPESTSEANG